jgi:hypothetical protein
VHPLLAIVRQDDLIKAHAKLAWMSCPFDGAYHHKRDLHQLDALNAHIRAMKARKPALAKTMRLEEARRGLAWILVP